MTILIYMYLNDVSFGYMRVLCMCMQELDDEIVLLTVRIRCM